MIRSSWMSTSTNQSIDAILFSSWCMESIDESNIQPPTIIRVQSGPKRTASQRKRESAAANELNTNPTTTNPTSMSTADDTTMADVPGTPTRRGRPRTKSGNSPTAATSSTSEVDTEMKSPSPSRKRKKSGATAEPSQGDVPVSQSQDVLSITPTEATDEATEPPKKKGRGRSKSGAAAESSTGAAMDETKEDAAEEPTPIKKKGRAKSAVVTPAKDDEEGAAEPVAKKGRAKSTGGASSSKKKKATGGTQDGSQQDEDDGEGGGSNNESVVAATLLEIEAKKRAARPAGSKTLMCWNVNGLRAALRAGAAAYLTQVDADIIALCEVKADADTVKKEFDYVGEDGVTSGIAAAFARTASAPKYYKYWNCCTTKKGYSGTAIFSKIKPISIVNGIGAPKHDDEGRTITAEFDDFYLVVTYVPNSGQKLERLPYRTTEWDQALLAYLQGLQAKKPVIWTGDLNVAHHDIDIHNPKTNQKSAGFTPAERKNFAATVTEHGFIDVFHHLYPEPTTPSQRFTYWGHRFDSRATNKGWRLDYWVVTPTLMKSHILDTWIGSELSEGSKGKRRSDHAPIFLNMK